MTAATHSTSTSQHYVNTPQLQHLKAQVLALSLTTSLQHIITLWRRHLNIMSVTEAGLKRLYVNPLQQCLTATSNKRSSHHSTALHRQTGTAQVTSNNRVHLSCLHRQTGTAQVTSKTEFIILSQHLPPQTDSLNRSNSSSNFQHFSTIRQTPI